MSRINRDAIIAILILLGCAAIYLETGNIRPPLYGGVGAAFWPRVVLVFIAFITLIYLKQSLSTSTWTQGAGGVKSPDTFLKRYGNALWCYGLYLAFALTLPYLGVLIGGILFVFLVLTTTGNRDWRSLRLHAVVSLVIAGGFWVLFTFALRVILPRGEILRF